MKRIRGCTGRPQDIERGGGGEAVGRKRGTVNLDTKSRVCNRSPSRKHHWLAKIGSYLARDPHSVISEFTSLPEVKATSWVS